MRTGIGNPSRRSLAGRFQTLESEAIGVRVPTEEVTRITCPVIIETDNTQIGCAAWGTCQILQCWTDGRVGIMGPCRTEPGSWAGRETFQSYDPQRGMGRPCEDASDEDRTDDHPRRVLTTTQLTAELRSKL